MRAPKPDTCQTWPSCMCARKMTHWSLMLPRMLDPCGPPPDPELTEFAKDDLILVLSCVEKNCPDAFRRYHATLQLLRPIFADRKAELEGSR